MSQSELPRLAGTPLRCACIDCGSNSVKLLVADLTGDSAVPVYELSDMTRIGEGMARHGLFLQDAPMARTLDAIERFAAAARANGAIETVLIGTAALRDARNGSDFAKQVRSRCGLRLDIIPGEEEARLSFLAVRNDPHWRSAPRLLVIDIGGGSTELIQGVAGSLTFTSRTSVNLGAVKLKEACLHSDPPSADELEFARETAAAAFGAVRLHSLPESPYHVVGVGGTISNLGGMALAAADGSKALHGLSLPAEEVARLCALLAACTIDERRMLPGLDPRRADIIVAGAMLLLQALKTIPSDHVDVSTRGLRWGLLYDRFMSDN